MSVRVVLIFLLVMVVMALLRGPAFRKGLAKILGIGRRDR
jgi:hypothetical protein